jgi:hypothetical protein
MKAQIRASRAVTSTSNNNYQEIPFMKCKIEQLLERIDDLAWISPIDAEREANR